MSASKPDQNKKDDKIDSDNDILEKISNYILSFTIIQLIIILLVILWSIYFS